MLEKVVLRYLWMSLFLGYASHRLVGLLHLNAFVVARNTLSTLGTKHVHCLKCDQLAVLIPMPWTLKICFNTQNFSFQRNTWIYAKNFGCHHFNIFVYLSSISYLFSFYNSLFTNYRNMHQSSADSQGEEPRTGN